MLKSHIDPIALIRLWALISRFLIIGFAAIELSASDFGKWSLVIAAISLLSYLVGLDLYAPAVRVIYEAKSKSDVVATFLALLLIYGFNFSVVCVLLFGVDEFRAYSIGHTPIALIAPLLLFEHLSAEANRQLNLLGELKHANIVLLVRSSLPIVVFGFFCVIGENGLNSLLLSQIIGTVAALWPAWLFLARYIDKIFPKQGAEGNGAGEFLPKVKQLLKGCGFVFLTTCFLKAGQTLDRQFLSTLTDMPRVGGYALIMAASSAVASVVDAVLISTSISKLINSAKQNGISDQICLHHQLRHRILCVSGVLHLVVLAGIFVFKMNFIQGKYEINSVDLIILIGASFVSNYSLADAALMFALKMDRSALFAAITGFGALCLTILFLASLIGANAVACGVFAAAIATWFVRKISVLAIISEESRNNKNI